MEFGVIGEQCFDRFFDNVFLVAPSSVSADHLSELGSVVSEMIDPDRIIAEEIIDLVNGVSDYRAPDMADVERLSDIGGGIFDNYLFARSHIAAAEIISFSYDFAHRIFNINIPGKEHIHISVHRLHFIENRLASDFFRDVLGDHRRRLA